METNTTPHALLDTIRVAIESTATAEQKQAGATACRALLAALDTKPGVPLAPPRSPSPFAQLAAMPPEQLVELIVSKLRPLRLADEAPR